MKKLTILFLLIISHHAFIAQNLVPNSSFENIINCPREIGGFSRNVKYWSIPNLGTTDFFSLCSRRIGLNNYNGNQNPKEGKTFAGFYLFSPENYREYIQGNLYKKLEKGKIYNVKFYISLAEKATHALNNISILFTEDVLGFTKIAPQENKSILTSKNSNHRRFQHVSREYITPSKYTQKAFELYDLESDDFYDNTDEWTEVNLEFIANGFETYFTIGNFKSNAETEKQETLNIKEKHEFSYYYIDAISIEQLDEFEAPIIEVNTIYIFKNVLFDFDKSELLGVSIKELDQLYQYLNTNLKLSVEIYGHTDNVGTQKRNEELSQQRAKAVAEHLILRGLKKTRITSFGFGSTKPVADNKTKEGRDLNRRVEFKLIDN
jgi:OOP family OmpA-OmpF porin